MRQKPAIAFCLVLPWLAAFFLQRAEPASLPIFLVPDWTYLLNGLAVASGIPPGQPDHPGLPVHWISSLALTFRHLLAGAGSDLIPAVLASPERWLYFLGGVFGGLNVIAFSAVGLITWRHFGLGPASLFTALAFTTPQMLVHFRRVSPESFFPALTCALLLLLSRFFSRRDPGLRELAAFAALFGIGLATKIVFAPAGALLFLWRRARHWVAFIAIASAVLLVALLPVLHAWKSMLRFYEILLFQEGQYGTGQPGIFPLAVVAKSYAAVLANGPNALVFGLGFGAFLWMERQRPTWRRRALLAATALSVLTLLMVSKHGDGADFPGQRYLLPSHLLLAWLWAVLLCRRDPAAPKKARIALVVAVALVGFNAVLTAGAWKETRRAERFSMLINSSFRASVAAHPSCAIFFHEAHMVREIALIRASALTSERMREHVREARPRAFALREDNWDKSVMELPAAAWAERMRNEPCVITMGNQLGPAELGRLLPAKEMSPLHPEWGLYLFLQSR